ncbi:MAG: dihydroorotate dehydrogenase-like protein [Acidobacteriota bacterium]
MTDLSTTYMGLKLRNPIIVGSCDLTSSLRGVIRSEEEGAGAVVLKSFFEEQFWREAGPAEKGSWVYPEAADYLERGGLLEYTTQKLCRLIEEAKAAVKIPVIASVNCLSSQLWPRFARHFEEAGADGLELNIYFLPFELQKSGAEYEKLYVQILEQVKKTVSIPVSVKLASQLTSIPHLSQKLADSGSRALVFFNWFTSPDIDLAQLKTRSLIGRGDFHQSLRWVGICSGRVECDIAASGGVRGPDQVVKLILAGASAVQVASLFQLEGLKNLPSLLKGLEEWMAAHGFGRIEDFRGELSFKRQSLVFKEPKEAEAYFRAQYMRTYLSKE